jgi:hypothetical protein
MEMLLKMFAETVCLKVTDTGPVSWGWSNSEFATDQHNKSIKITGNI